MSKYSQEYVPARLGITEQDAQATDALQHMLAVPEPGQFITGAAATEPRAYPGTPEEHKLDTDYRRFETIFDSDIA